MSDTVRIKVTRERYEEVVSIEDDMHFFELTNREAYEYMTHFCLNGSEDTYLEPEQARKLFKKIPRKEFDKYVTQFVKAIGDAFVPPPNGADSSELLQPE